MSALSNKVAIITGASSGIGYATAKLFAREGAKIVIAARRQAALDALVEEITQAGGHAVALAGDVKDEAFAKTLVELAVGRFLLTAGPPSIEPESARSICPWRIQMSDYDRIAKAISFIASRVDSQPTLQEIAGHLHLSPFHFQRLFSRWAGVTPKRFLQVLTLERAKQLLSESKPLLEVSDSLGLSSGSRLYDHFIHLEAVTPGEYKMGGAGLTIEYAVHDTPFGRAFIAATPRGICGFAFLEHAEIDGHLIDLHKKWPHAMVYENRQRTLTVIKAMFGDEKKSDRPVSLHVSGTNFQINVWKALLQIPPAKVASYSQVATAIGHPSSARAVGLAVGANPVAFLIPCHRVIQQSGKLGGYHWGETRKQAIHAWEAARYE